MTEKRCAFGKVASLLVLALLSAAGTTAKPPAEFIWLSDLHFDPTADPTLVDTLAGASTDDWARILGSGAPTGFSHVREDTNWTLLSSAFEAVKKTSPDAQFTLVTGDVLAHHFREKFESATKSQDDRLFQRFTQQTMQFLAAQLGALAPGKPVLFAIGNNDSECGDYQVQPHGAFLREESNSIKTMLGPLGDEASVSDWAGLGSYSVRHPSLKQIQVISVNTVFFSPKYRDTCSAGGVDPAREEMQWLQAKLADARQRKKKVWLIFHIPPGIDGYATSNPKSAGSTNKIVPMWKPLYTEEFEKLLSKYSGTVTISLAGHEHMDDFRLLANSLILLTPGLSPIVGQNPAFRVVAFGRTGTLLDEKTYYLSNLDMGVPGAASAWKLEYSFAKTWNTRQFDFKNFSKLYREINARPELRDRWATLYEVSRPDASARARQSFGWLFCASGNATEASYRACEEQSESATGK